MGLGRMLSGGSGVRFRSIPALLNRDVCRGEIPRIAIELGALAIKGLTEGDVGAPTNARSAGHRKTHREKARAHSAQREAQKRCKRPVGYARGSSRVTTA